MFNRVFSPRHIDPMREVDLILLEDAMMHRNVETSRTAVALQTASMTILALFFLAAFFYSLTHPESVVGRASELEPPQAALGSLPGYAGLRQP
jgi:hypothetical protein